jgi:hypothetical protein
MSLNKIITIDDCEDCKYVWYYLGVDAKTISESQLWSILSASDYRFVGNPMAKAEAIKMMLPKLRGTARNLLELSLKEQVIPDEDLPEITAYVKIVTLENYTADDNPPMQVMQQIAEARKSGLFSCMVIAYPMVGPVKKIDPIVIGLVQDPNKEYPALGSIDRLWLNGEAPIDYMRSLDWGSMFKITEWI